MTIGHNGAGRNRPPSVSFRSSDIILVDGQVIGKSLGDQTKIGYGRLA